MEPSKQEVSRMMAEIREGALPGSEVIVNTAFEESGYRADHPDQLTVRKEFNRRLREVFEYTLVVLERF